MVSNDEIRKRLAEKRKSPNKNRKYPNKKSLTEDRTISSDELKEKFREKRSHESENLGYLVCDKCGGYYQLQPGESPEDFEICQCGGELKYTENLDEFFNSKDTNSESS